MRLTLLLSLAFFSLTNAISFQSVPSPNLDLSGLGSVMLAGNFDSISLYNYVGQDEDGLSPNGSQSLYGRYPTGAFAQLSSSDGYIEAMCSFVAANGMLNGIVVGGNFTGFGNNPAPAAALFNPTDGSITALNGINGQISAVYCDNDASIVYVGGSFQGGNSTNAIAWVNGWTNLPFAGFNGPVSAITKLPNGHIVFGGRFTEIGNLTTMVHGLPTQPQVINVGSANVSATGATANPKYENPSDIICSPPGQHSNSEFLLAKDTPGSITADFGYGFIPTHLRLLNTQVANRGTKTWSYTFFPNGGIANFTYYDDNGDQRSCTNSCPLVQNSTYQDFYFVNRIMMNSFRLDISDWYGEGAGLGGIELFQNSLWAYAVDNFNSPNCDGVANRNASATTTGPWMVTPSGDSMSQYLTANIPGGTQGGAATNYSVVFTPNIEQSGNYSINMWTPGCQADNTCATRGQVNITANLGSPTGTSSAPYTTTLYQTNNNLKFDQIYFGYVDVSDGFRPSITLTPSSGQAGPLTVVAGSLGLNLTSAFNQNSSSGSSSMTTTTSDAFSTVNGLYEYNPDTATVTSDTSNSMIDAAGVSLNDGAQVLALTMADSVLYAAGAFRTDSFQHIFSVDTGNATDLANGGLNDVVQSLFYLDGKLYAGGNFSNTGDNSSAGLNNVASWSTSAKTWSALGAGVNGIVYNIIPLQVNVSGSEVQAIAVSGYFDQINAFGSNPSSTVNDIALWIPARNNWLPNLDLQAIAIDGRLNAYTPVPDQDPIFAGSISSGDLGGSRNAAGLSSTEGLSLMPYPFNIQAPSTSASSSNAKRDIPQSSAQGAYTGYYFEENGLNLTIVGGHFEAMASNGSRISNLAILNQTDGTTVTGLAYNDSSDASVYALATQNTTLFIGGSFEDGILFYDLATGQLASSQPPALTGNGGAAHALALQPKTNDLYVGGTFGRAGSLGCAGLCIYATDLRQWSPPPTALSGDNTINFLQWASSTRLIIAGELNVAGNRTTMAEYDTKSNEFTTVTNADTLPGPITAFTSVDNSFTAAFAAGIATSNSSAYLSHFDGKSTWTGVGGFGPQTKIQGLQIMSVNGGGSGNRLVPSGQTLLVMGMLELPSYGNVSAAFFNGTDFTPMALSTLGDGRPGSIYGAFVQNPANLLNGHSNHLALGFVVLIGLACALGVVFLVVVLGILIERFRRQREGYVPAPTGAVMYEKSAGGKIGNIPADRLFGGVGKGGGNAPRI